MICCLVFTFLIFCHPGLFGLLFKNYGQVSLARNTILIKKEVQRLKHCVLMECLFHLQQSMILFVFLKDLGITERCALGTAMAVPRPVQSLLRMTTAHLCENRGRREQATLQRKQGRREIQQEPSTSPLWCYGASYDHGEETSAPGAGRQQLPPIRTILVVPITFELTALFHLRRHFSSSGLAPGWSPDNWPRPGALQAGAL